MCSMPPLYQSTGVQYSSASLRCKRLDRCADPYSAESTRLEPAHWGMVSVSRLAGPPQQGQVVLTQSVILAKGDFAVVRRLISCQLPAAPEAARSSGSGTIAAFLAMDDGDRLAPVALTGEYPVAQLVVDLAPSADFPAQPLGIFSLAVLLQ